MAGKWLVGYQVRENSVFLQEILKRKAHIGEVYFSWGSLPSGRHGSTVHPSLTEWEAARKMEADLTAMREAGIAFNLLLNAGCYGADSLSRHFLRSTCDLVDEMRERFSVRSVTTTSPVLANLIRDNFSGMEVRASVNMGIGTVEAMEYLADTFNGFYFQREKNRDRAALLRLRVWCQAHGKKSYLLANSGCLNDCPVRHFHDNLVAHEQEIVTRDNAVTFQPLCRDVFQKSTDPGDYLRRLSFIRPEDVHLYDGLSDGIKLATRVHPFPERVLRAYDEERWNGNLPDLTEPSHSAVLYPRIIENSALPECFGETVSSCGQKCRRGEACAFCTEAARQALRELPREPAG